jgi:transposase
MKRTKDGRKLYSRDFKIAAIRKVEMGELQAVVARELKINVSVLARWRKQFRQMGEAGLGEIGRRVGRPEKPQDGTRIAELERLIGKQQAVIDFLEQALHQVEDIRRTKKGSGGRASSE